MSETKRLLRMLTATVLALCLQAVEALAGSQPSPATRIWKWCEDFETARWIRCSFRYDGLPEIAEEERPAAIRMLCSIQARWPDTAIWTSSVWPSGQEPGASKPASDFTRLFRPDATVSASTDRRAIVTSTIPMLFAEEAWRYAYVSPWIVAHLMLAESRDSVAFDQDGQRTRVVLKNLGLTALFDVGTGERDARLVELRIFERAGRLETKYHYSDFRADGPAGLLIPWKFTAVGHIRIINPRTGKVTNSEAREIGTGTVLACDWPLSIGESEFEFPADILRATKRDSSNRARSDPKLDPTDQSLSGSQSASGPGSNFASSRNEASTDSRDWHQLTLFGLCAILLGSVVWWVRRHSRMQ
ncbi:MAG: hypothetical protein JNM86_07095 [Phycisphaerae bacterium]|nr:hypothetical protein [Phycisphaerae bacterium]